MKILHLVHRTWPYHGGAERYVWEHAVAALRWGHESTVYSTDAWDMSWLVSRKGKSIDSPESYRDGVRIVRFRVLHPPLQNLLRGTLRRLMPCGADRFFYPNPFLPGLHSRLGRDREFDFVHANAMPFLLWEGFRYASKRGAGLASVPHGNLGERFRRTAEIRYLAGCQPEILRKSSLVVAQNRFERDVYVDLGVDPERVLVLGSGIDPREFDGASRLAGRKRLGIPEDVRVVLTLTALSREKGTVALLESSLDLWKSGINFTLVLAGPRMPDFDAFLRSIAEQIPPGRLVLTGMVKREARADLIAAADVFALPSRLDCFGIVLLEAWVCGLPVVGCWAGAMPDLVADGETGFLVGFDDTETLASRLRVLIDSEGLRREMGEKGRRLVESRYTWDSVTDRFYARITGCLTKEGIR